MQFSDCCYEAKLNQFSELILFSFAEIERVQKGEPKKESETYLDLYTRQERKGERESAHSCEAIPSGKQYTLSEFCMYNARTCFWLTPVLNVPPQFNFVGKILGPQGSTIKRLQEDTGAKISVLGKGSMRDKNKVMNQAVMLLGVRLSDLVTKD